MYDALEEQKKIIEKTNKKALYESVEKQSITKVSQQYCLEMIELPYLDEAPKGYNIGINDGVVAGRTIHHLHIHLIPRYNGDVTNPIGGVRSVIPGKADYTIDNL